MLFKAMSLIVRVAPFGVLGAVAYTVGRYGVGSLKQLLSLVVLYYVSVAFVRLRRTRRGHAHGRDQSVQILGLHARKS